MFTGLITAVGEVVAVSDSEAGRELVVASPYRDLVVGESIACSGACLTVREVNGDRFTVAAVAATRERTSIGDWGIGSRINLERALAVGDRFGGHFVQGHVDGVGQVVRAERDGDSLILEVEVPNDLEDFIVPQGSVAIDGVSLTIQALPAPNLLRVAVIDHTLTHTTLGSLRVGDGVQVETDLIAKHIKRLAAPLIQP